MTLSGSVNRGSIRDSGNNCQLSLRSMQRGFSEVEVGVSHKLNLAIDLRRCSCLNSDLRYCARDMRD